jgi:ketosteroid isomerase-like protein
MSQENVEIVREAIEAFNRGDFEAALKWMHRDIEWQTLDAFPDAATYHGLEEVRVLADVAGHVSRLSVAPGGMRAGRRALCPRHLPG